MMSAFFPTVQSSRCRPPARARVRPRAWPSRRRLAAGRTPGPAPHRLAASRPAASHETCRACCCTRRRRRRARRRCRGRASRRSARCLNPVSDWIPDSAARSRAVRPGSPAPSSVRPDAVGGAEARASCGETERVEVRDVVVARACADECDLVLLLGRVGVDNEIVRGGREGWPWIRAGRACTRPRSVARAPHPAGAMLAAA